MAQTFKKKVEFSKVLVVLITVYFFATLTMAIAYWLLTGRILPSEFLWAISGPFASVTGFYLVKSGWENSARNSSCNYDPNYGQGNYNMPTYNPPRSNTMYSNTMYGQNAQHQYTRPQDVYGGSPQY